MNDEDIKYAVEKLREAFGVKRSSQTYGETVVLHHKYWKQLGGLRQPEGCPCGWDDDGETVKFTLRRGCPTHRPTPVQYPRPPFDEKGSPIDTPPVLRWERGDLFFYKKWMATVFKRSGKWAYSFNTELRTRGVLFDTEQEARRAAEEALGFPDGLVVDESN